MPQIRYREERQAMNSFALGKLAEIHIQNPVDGADESRRARRGTPQRLIPRRMQHFHRHKELGTTFPIRAMTK